MTKSSDIEEARAELAQLGSVLADAIVRLTASFEGIHALRPESGERREAFDARIGEAVTALQFEDIATQLIARIDARLSVGDAKPRTAGRSCSPIRQTHLAQGGVELF